MAITPYYTTMVKTILKDDQIQHIIRRLSHEIIENHLTISDTVLISIQPRGIFLGDRIVQEIKNTFTDETIYYGKLDITFYRDDIRKELHVANKTDVPFSIEGKNVVLVDDVLWTGRTIRAALDALLDFGRPRSVQLCVLINRRFGRELPIQADYIGKSIDTFDTQKVKVQWKEYDEKDQVLLLEN